MELGERLAKKVEEERRRRAESPEAQIQRYILENLKRQDELTQLLMPYLMEDLGYRIVEIDGKRTLERIPWEEQYAKMTPSQQKQWQMEQAFINQQLVFSGINPDSFEKFQNEEEMMGYMTPEQQRTYNLQKETSEYQLRALRGELPVSPGLERALGKQEEMTREELAARLGSQYEQTTAGIQTLGQVKESAEITREEARRGMLTTAAGIRGALSGEMMGQQQMAGQGYGQMVGVRSGLQQQRLAGLGGAPGMYGNITGQYLAALQPYQQDRWQREQIAAMNKAGQMNLLGQIIGTGVGIAAGKLI